MPRSPKFIHPIRRLRGEIGYTQRKFAALIGVSTSALQQIELGVLKLPPKIEGRIVSVTGVKGACLRGRRGKLVNPAGEPFTRKHFEQRGERATWKASEFEQNYVAKELQRRVEVILEAAGKLKRFDVVENELWNVLDSLRKTHGLEKLTDDLLRRGRDPRQNWTALAAGRRHILFTDAGVRKMTGKATLEQVAAIVRQTQSKRAVGRICPPGRFPRPWVRSGSLGEDDFFVVIVDLED